MNKIKLLALILFLSACSATGPLYREEVRAQDKATVYIYRPHQYFNAGGWPEIFVDGNKLFPLKNEGYGVITLTAGKHTIKAEGSMLFTNWYPRPVEITHEFEADGEYYIRVTPQLASVTPIANSMVVQGNGNISVVPKEIAIGEIAKTKKVN